MAALSRWERVSRCLLAGLDDETIARACGIDIEDAALYRKQLDQGERVRMRKDVEINAMLRELGLSRAEAYYLLRTATKKDIDKIFRGGGKTMSEMMSLTTWPGDPISLAAENRMLRERLEAAEASNDVLTAEIEEREKTIAGLIGRNRRLRAERDDARHERDTLRERRDRAYLNAFTQNRIDRRGQKRIERALFALITAAWGIPALVILCGKALEWARWMMGN